MPKILKPSTKPSQPLRPTRSTKVIKPSKPVRITPFQEKVYTLLPQIPSGRITSYATLATVLATSPRAIGNALRVNPFAPEVPCHRVITRGGFIGGFMGECDQAASGVNQVRKRALLAGEGVVFDERGMLLGGEEMWFDGPWNLSARVARRSNVKAEGEEVKVNS